MLQHHQHAQRCRCQELTALAAPGRWHWAIPVTWLASQGLPRRAPCALSAPNLLDCLQALRSAGHVSPVVSNCSYHCKVCMLVVAVSDILLAWHMVSTYF